MLNASKLLLILSLLGTTSCVTYTTTRHGVSMKTHKPKAFIKTTRAGTYQCFWYFGKEYCAPFGRK